MYVLYTLCALTEHAYMHIYMCMIEFCIVYMLFQAAQGVRTGETGHANHVQTIRTSQCPAEMQPSALA